MEIEMEIEISPKLDRHQWEKGQVGTHRFAFMFAEVAKGYAAPLASPSSIHSTFPLQFPFRCRSQLPCFSAGYQKEKGLSIGACLWPKMCCSQQLQQLQLFVGLVHSGRSQSQRRDQTATALGISNCLCLPPSQPSHFTALEKYYNY